MFPSQLLVSHVAVVLFLCNWEICMEASSNHFLQPSTYCLQLPPLPVPRNPRRGKMVSSSYVLKEREDIVRMVRILYIINDKHAKVELLMINT